MIHYAEGAFWRPLFETNMIMLQVAKGCSHNRCKFCDMYHAPFEASPLEEVASDIEEMSHLRGCPSRLFLAGGNAFCLPAETLLEIARLVHEKLPRIQSIGCFARIEDVAGKTDDELAALFEAGFDMLSIGAESGWDAVLERMDKGHTAADIVEQCTRLDNTGMCYAFFYLAGMAGAGRGIENARRSIEVFSQVNPDIIMIHTMTCFKGTVLDAEVRAGAFELEPEVEIMQELREFYAGYPKPVRILASHYANTVRFDGKLPEARDGMVELMDREIARADEAFLSRWRRSIQSI